MVTQQPNKNRTEYEQVKLPQLKVSITTSTDTPSNEEKQWIQVNPSCLLAYLGIRGYANTPKTGEKTIEKNALPILTYFDILFFPRFIVTGKQQKMLKKMQIGRAHV